MNDEKTGDQKYRWTVPLNPTARKQFFYLMNFVSQSFLGRDSNCLWQDFNNTVGKGLFSGKVYCTEYTVTPIQFITLVFQEQFFTVLCCSSKNNYLWIVLLYQKLLFMYCVITPKATFYILCYYTKNNYLCIVLKNQEQLFMCCVIKPKTTLFVKCYYTKYINYLFIVIL